MTIDVQRGIEHGSEASHESVMSQSLVTSGGATIGHLLVMKGSFF